MYFLDELDEEDYEIAIKVVIVGNGAVGKSSMIQRYCKGIFTKDYKKTIGVDFLEKHITASGEDVRLMLWDTAGQEEFDAITKAYYRGAQACVIAFSTTDRNSFEAVKKWKRKVEDECGHIPMVLVQNKIDLLHEAQVDSYEVEKFARNTGLKLFRTSVKENLNISRVFQFLSERHIEAVSRWSTDNEYLDGDGGRGSSHHTIGSNNSVFQIGGHGGGGGRGENRVRFAGFPSSSNGDESSGDSINTLNNNSNPSSKSHRQDSSHRYFGTTKRGQGPTNHPPPGGQNGIFINSKHQLWQGQPSPEKNLILLNPFRKKKRSRKNGSQGSSATDSSSNSPSPPVPGGFHPHHGFGGGLRHQNHYHRNYSSSSNRRFTLHQQPPLAAPPLTQKPTCKMI